MGEKTREALKLQFDKRLRLEFHGARKDTSSRVEMGNPRLYNR